MSTPDPGPSPPSPSSAPRLVRGEEARTRLAVTGVFRRRGGAGGRLVGNWPERGPGRAVEKSCWAGRGAQCGPDIAGQGSKSHQFFPAPEPRSQCGGAGLGGRPRQRGGSASATVRSARTQRTRPVTSLDGCPVGRPVGASIGNHP